MNQALAVIYSRVSTKEQAKENLSIPNQERACAEFIHRNGWALAETFVDAGKSAWADKERPGFVAMLEYVRQNKSVAYVVVYDLSRLTRRVRTHANFEYDLSQLGAEIRSVSEPNIDRTAFGKYVAHSVGNSNQFFSDQLSEKSAARTAASAKAGRYPWAAPVGYINVDEKRPGHPNIVPDEMAAHFVTRAFELLSTGQHKLQEVLRMVTSLGLRNKKGKPVSKQRFSAMMRSELYTGYVSVPKQKLRVRGLHTPLIGEGIFARCQDFLNGRKISPITHRRDRDDLPLKGVVLCSECGGKLTGGNPKSKLYTRYWCWKCNGTAVSKEQLESEFVELLSRLQVKPAVAKAMPAALKRIWKENNADAITIRRGAETELRDYQQLRQELIKAKLRKELLQDVFEETMKEYSGKIAELQNRIAAASTQDDDINALIEYGDFVTTNISAAWQQAALQQRRQVQSLLFPEGILYSNKNGYLNDAKTSLFNDLSRVIAPDSQFGVPDGI